MTVAFDGIGSVIATFLTESDIAGGEVVKLTDNGTVGLCAEGEAFCGVALPPREGAGAVQLRGFVTVSYSGTAPEVGPVTLAADGAGGVMTADSGVSALAVAVDEDEMTAVILL